jgi:hypothetical protein
VVTRRVPVGAGQERRKTFQTHLLIFLGVNVAVLAIDLMTRPGIQFWEWVGFFTGVILIVHAFGLISRGFTVGELLVPPRAVGAGIDEEGPPLEYELVKSRQLRDGVSRAAASIRERTPQLVDEAVQLADELVDVVEDLVPRARSAGADAGRLERLTPAVGAAVERLDDLHAGLIRASVLDEPPEEALPVEAARQEVTRLRELAREVSGAGDGGS